MLKVLQMNDPLPLRLGAKVGPAKSPVSPGPVPAGHFDGVTWVGDVLDDEVQVSDMAHPAAPLSSPLLQSRLFGGSSRQMEEDRKNRAMRDLVDRMVADALTPMRVFVDPGSPDGHTAAAAARTWVFTPEAAGHLAEIGVSDYQRGLAGVQTATGLQQQQAGMQRLRDNDFAINGRGGYSEEEYRRWLTHRKSVYAEWAAE